MKPPERGALLSINAAATRQFFDDERIKGLRIRAEGDTIAVQPVRAKSGADVVPLERRGRGGLGANIDPEATNPDIFRLLRRQGYRSTVPFFLLTEGNRNWLTIEHWSRGNPPLNRPHMRVWMSDTTSRGRNVKIAEKRTAERSRAAKPEEEEAIDWRQLRRTLTDAKAKLSRRGRLPRGDELVRDDARRVMQQFERLVDTILPERNATAANGLQDRLERALAHGEQMMRERDEAIDEVHALQRLLEEQRQSGSQEAQEPVQEPAEAATDVESEPAPPPRRRGGGRRRKPFMPERSQPETTEAEDFVREESTAAEAAQEDEVHEGTVTEPEVEAEPNEPAEPETALEESTAAEAAHETEDAGEEAPIEDAEEGVEDDAEEGGDASEDDSVEGKAESQDAGNSGEQPPTEGIAFPDDEDSPPR